MPNRLRASEFAEFEEFYSVEPWGFPQADYHAALIAQTVANASGRYQDPFKITDFMQVQDSLDDNA